MGQVRHTLRSVSDPVYPRRGVEVSDNTQFNIIITIIITEHSRSDVGVAYNFGLLCLSVCL